MASGEMSRDQFARFLTEVLGNMADASCDGYPGQHPAIIDRATSDAVNLRLKANASRVKAQTSAATLSPLAGKLTDEAGQRLTPSHAVRCGKRYCYYVSRRLVAESGKSDSAGWRLPAAALEGAVARLIIEALETPSAAQGLIDGATPEMLRKLPSAAKSLATALSGPDWGTTLRAIVASARIEPGRLSVTLCPEALAERLGVPLAHISDDALSLVGEFTLRRRGIEAKLVLANTPSSLDRTLLKTIALGWVWFEEIKAGATMQAIANREGVTQRRVAHLIDLAFLAPDIVPLDRRGSPVRDADRRPPDQVAASDALT
jgi:site-specific DNA recombinase